MVPFIQRRLLRLGLALALILGAVGCSRIQTPPTQVIAAEAPALVEVDQTSMDLGFSASGEVFGASGLTFSGGVRHGLHERVELQGAIEGSWFQHDTSEYEQENGRAHRGYYTGRVGTKVALFEHMALTAGLGLGHAPASGSFFGTDLGLTLGYENPYAVPFFHTRLYYSLPFAKKDIPAEWQLDAEPDAPASYENTFGTSYVAGLKIPIATHRALEGKTSYNLYLAFGFTFVYPNSYFSENDRDGKSGFMHGQTRFEVLFPTKAARARAQLEP